jgi:hypothetical protein
MRNGRIEVKIGEPIPHEYYRDKASKEFLKELRQTIIDLGN